MKDHEKLILYFSKHFPLNRSGLDEFVNSFNIESWSKGDIILKPGRIDSKLKFVSSGYLREFYSTNLKEVNINFYGEIECSSDINSFFNNTKTRKFQQCLTDVKILSMSKNKFDELQNTFSCISSAVQASLQNLLQKKESMEYLRTIKDAESQYKEILLKKKNWVRDIPQYHLASYLNITPETLSRIRGRIS